MYIGGFTNICSIINKFDINADELADKTIIMAYYDNEGWEGKAYVLLMDDDTGKLYEVHASHCSCYGLEGQWEPKEITVDTLEFVFDRKISTHRPGMLVESVLKDFVEYVRYLQYAKQKE